MTPIEFRQVRKTLRFTQEELAHKLGVEPNTVARWERGERPISQTTELAMNYLTDTGMRRGEGYRAVLEDLQLFVEMGLDDRKVGIFRAGKKERSVPERPPFSWETGGVNPNLGVFQRFAIEQAYKILGKKRIPTDEDILEIDWRRY